MHWWKSKRVIITGIAIAIIAVVAITGVVLAQTVTTTTPGKTFTARVAAILGIDEQKVKDAFNQAQREMSDEALDTRLQKLVEDGKLTQEQANQYKDWWQSRPDTLAPGDGILGRFGMRGFRGMDRWCLPEPPDTPSTN